jgi:cyclophilin family peptidyl-prolyl cis-trans isomerase
MRTRDTLLSRKLNMRRIAYHALSMSMIAFASLPTYGSQFVRLDHNLALNSRARDAVFFELFDDRPLSQANFMQYVNGGHYDGTLMHRLSRNFVMQGGGFYPVLVPETPPVNVSLDPAAMVDLDGNPGTPNPTVPNETGNVPPRSNLRGTVAMARLPAPNSAMSQWFVNLVNNPFLDTSSGGFAVFAQVRGDGMAMYDAFNGLSIANLNPDADNNGVREPGPFGLTANDGVPFLDGVSEDLLVVLEAANQVDYLGAGQTTIVPLAGLTLSTRDTFIDTGAVFTGTGSLTIDAGLELGIREGMLLSQALINQGTLAPGLELGSITVQSYQQHAGGTLEIQLRGTTDTQHDRLVVLGGALLGGTLDVSLLGGFVPTLGQQFTVLTGNSILDQFENFDLPTLSTGLRWDIDQSASALTLSVIAIPEPASVSMLVAAGVLLMSPSVSRRRF